MKRRVGEAKKEKDEELGRKLSRDFVTNRKLYHKEVKKIRGQQGSDCSKIKSVDGRLLDEKEEVLERWKQYFENLMSCSSEMNVCHDSTV